MKFKRIFGDNFDYKLLAVCYPEDKIGKKNVDIFRKKMREWNDTYYLYDFFSQNYTDLQHPCWGGLTIDDAIDKVLDEAQDFEAELKAIETKQPGYENVPLNEIFKNLHKDEFLLRASNSMQKKAKPYFPNPMLRFYAIELDGCFIITGGAIKLIEKMEGIYFENEVRKLKQLQEYFRIEQIVSKEGLFEDL
jgi:hypothetical protein